MKKNITVSLLFGIAVSATALFFAFRHVPFAPLWVYLSSINYLWIIPSVAIVFISFVLRALRWQIILRSVHKVTFWRAYHPLMIGFMINCILPGRAGELARPMILKKKDRVPFSGGLATVATERVFDIGILIILFGLMMMTVQVDPNLDISFGKYHLNKETLLSVQGGMIKLVITLIAGIVLLSIEKIRDMIRRVIMGLPSLSFFTGRSSEEKIREKICVPLIKIVDGFASGFSLIRYPKEMFFCIVLSFCIWSFSAFSVYLFAIGSPGIDLSFLEVFSMMIIICFFIALPSVPGFWGIWEAGGVFALSLFGVSTKEAAGFTLANHVIQIFPVIIMGFVSAVITGVNIWQVLKEKGQADIGHATS